MSSVPIDNALPANKLPSNAVADRLIAAGRRPIVLGFVTADSVEDLTGALFDVLAHVSNGADGIDLSLPSTVAPAERMAVADQLSEATGASMYVRADVPMAGGQHALILSASAGQLRPGANAVYDMGIDRHGSPADSVVDAWPSTDDERSLLLSTVGFRDLSDEALMGVATAATVRGITAVSSDRTHIVRRVVDTLAPLQPDVPKGRVGSCR